MPYPVFLAGQVLTADDLTEALEKVVEQGSDQSVSSSATPVGSNLSFAVVSGGVYWVQVRARWTQPSPGGGFRAEWAAPAGTSSLRLVLAAGDTATGGSDDATTMTSRAWVLSQEITAGSGLGESSTHAWHEDILLTAGDDGTVTFEFAQNDSNANATVLSASSFLLWRRVG